MRGPEAEGLGRVVMSEHDEWCGCRECLRKAWEPALLELKREWKKQETRDEQESNTPERGE
jgi:hypothetical protein